MNSANALLNLNFFLTCDDVPTVGTAHLLLAGLRVVGLQQVNHFSVVGDGGAIAGGREGDGQVHTSVIVLTWSSVMIRGERCKIWTQLWKKGAASNVSFYVLCIYLPTRVRQVTGHESQCSIKMNIKTSVHISYEKSFEFSFLKFYKIKIPSSVLCHDLDVSVFGEFYSMRTFRYIEMLHVINRLKCE